MKFPENLKKLRKRYKISQERLAEKLNRTNTTISNWETGINQPDFESLFIIREIFKVDLDTLLVGDVYDISEKREFSEKLNTEVCTMPGGCALRRMVELEAKMEEQLKDRK